MLLCIRKWNDKLILWYGFCGLWNFIKRYDKCLLVRIKWVEFGSINKNKISNSSTEHETKNNFSVATKFDGTNFGSFGVFGKIHLKIAQRERKWNKIQVFHFQCKFSDVSKVICIFILVPWGICKEISKGTRNFITNQRNLSVP